MLSGIGLFCYLISFSLLFTPSIPPTAPSRTLAKNFINVNIVNSPLNIIKPAVSSNMKNMVPHIKPHKSPFSPIILLPIKPEIKAEIPQRIVKRISNTILFKIPVLLIITAVIHSNTIKKSSPNNNPTTIPLISLNLLSDKVKVFNRKHPRICY